ncbi:fluoride efflux transporter CrcB [Algicella marina]|uniref:Fluoride-specific ion channel FluC n=1 Tax=Algicella marina TaxID=2683284 RepID=A0A6P1SX92_9RHOB|nr:fluoride efflux transporter CrcB [Algicella marina]QHQ33826.1 fluoride efflux transporter CrcB [Algicella marina]
MNILLQIAAGGAIGATLRYLTVSRIAAAMPGGFPAGTILVNVVGSFLMGAIFAVAMTRAEGLRPLLPFFATGLLGGFTTFSAFSLDTLLLIEEGKILAAMAYITSSVLLSLLALACGLWLVRGV